MGNEGSATSQILDRRSRVTWIGAIGFNLFPKNFDGMQLILSRYIENDLESVGFKVNDAYVIPTRPLIERTMLIRHKERKFGRGCVREWTTHRQYLCAQFAELLKPIDNMLAASPFLLTDRPLFVDYSLYGVLGNYLFNGKTTIAKSEAPTTLAS